MHTELDQLIAKREKLQQKQFDLRMAGNLTRARFQAIDNDICLLNERIDSIRADLRRQAA